MPGSLRRPCPLARFCPCDLVWSRPLWQTSGNGWRRADVISAALARLSARVELGIRITAQETAALKATLTQIPDLQQAHTRLSRGADHFQKVEFGRKLGEAMARRRADAQKTALASLVPNTVEHVLRAPEHDTEVLRADILIERDHIAAVTESVEKMCAELDFAAPEPCDAKIVGPGPAFSFVDLVLDEGPGSKAA